MEFDRLKPGWIIYTDLYALKTSDGTSTQTIAGDTTEYGYREGVASQARFSDIGGFAQLTENSVVVVDRGYHCLRHISRVSSFTSRFSGYCMRPGYENGKPGYFKRPTSVAIDRMDNNQLLVTDHHNNAVRTVTIDTRIVGTFAQSPSLEHIESLTQHPEGDIYVIAWHAIYRISYKYRYVTLTSGKAGMVGGYRDSTLLDSLFYLPSRLLFTSNQHIVVTDTYNNKLRLVDLYYNRVTTLNICVKCLNEPDSLLLTQSYLYIGQLDGITKVIGKLQKQTITPDSRFTLSFILYFGCLWYYCSLHLKHIHQHLYGIRICNPF